MPHEELDLREKAQSGKAMKIHLNLKRLAESMMWRCFAISGMRFRLRSGMSLSVADKHEMATFREIFIQQDYDEFLELLPSPRSVLDLGCNSGYFAAQILNRSLIAHEEMPKLVLVDASSTAVKRAQAVLGEAGIPAKPHMEFQHGLLAKRGQKSATFFLAPSSAESSTIHRAKNAHAVTVPCIDLSSLVNQHFPDGIDLIKCDIEGGEEELVREWQDVLAQTRALLVEWHGFEGAEWSEFAAILSAMGFILERERPAGRYKNALFLRSVGGTEKPTC